VRKKKKEVCFFFFKKKKNISYAARRAVSIYLPETTFPMLPQGVSHAMSILPGRVTHTMTFAARLRENGEILEKRVFNSLIRKVCKITYNSADALLSNESRPAITVSAEHEKTLRRLNEIAVQRKAMREARGAVSVHLPRAKVRLQGQKVQFITEKEKDTISRSLIKEIMILGGQVQKTCFCFFCFCDFVCFKRLLLSFREIMTFLFRIAFSVAASPPLPRRATCRCSTR
jgi:exoribonuclease II